MIYFSIFSGDWHPILTSLKYCSYIGGPPDEELESLYAEKPWQFVPDAYRAYERHDDWYQLACVMYCFFKKKVLSSHLDYPMRLQWNEEELKDYQTVHLKHLIKLVFFLALHENRSLDVSIKDILHHPYFQSHSWLVGFMDCLKMFNKRYQGLDAKMEVINILPDENFEHWEEENPQLFMNMFTTCAVHKVCIRNRSNMLCELPELNRFFPASQDFYETCAKITIVD